MSRLSKLLLMLKVLPVVILAGFCLYQIHLLLNQRKRFVKKEVPGHHLSEQETRALEHLRHQLRKNLLLQQEREQERQAMQQKLTSLEHVIDQQKKQIQLQTQQLQQAQQSQSLKLTQKTQHEKQEYQIGNQSNFIREVEVQGQRLSLHPSVNVVPSVPPRTSTLDPRICVPLPKSPLLTTICIRDPKADSFLSGVIQTGELWEDDCVQNMLAILKKLREHCSVMTLTDDWDPGQGALCCLADGGGGTVTSYPDMGLVDLGANIGVYTLAAAAGGRRVLSVDMQDVNILHLQHSLQENNISSQVVIVKNAVYKDHNSKLSYRTYVNNTARSYIVENSEGTDTVQSVCLDDLIPLVSSQLVFMRIDLVNTEHQALLCGQEFFTRINIRVVQVKWGRKSPEIANWIGNFMSHYNYTASVLIDGVYHLWDVRYANWSGDVFFFK